MINSIEHIKMIKYVVIKKSMIRLNFTRKSYLLLVIVFIVFKRYPRTYCLMQGSCNFHKIKKGPQH